jgi:hypothetical protein
MNDHCTRLFSELQRALLDIDLPEEAAKVSRWAEQIRSGSRLEKEAAVKQIEGHCHVKVWGDLNLNVVGHGDDPVYEFLDRVRKAAREAVL